MLVILKIFTQQKNICEANAFQLYADSYVSHEHKQNSVNYKIKDGG